MINKSLLDLRNKVKSGYYFNNGSRVLGLERGYIEESDLAVLPESIGKFASALAEFYGDLYKFWWFKPSQVGRIVDTLKGLWGAYENLLNILEGVGDEDYDYYQYEIGDCIKFVQDDIKFFVADFEYSDLFFTPAQIQEINNWKI